MTNILDRAIDCEENIVADLLEENVSLQEALKQKKTRPKTLTLKEKKMILSELKDIYDIEVIEGDNDGQIIFYFKRMDLYLDLNRKENLASYSSKIPFYYLWKLGFIRFRTSKSRLIMKTNENGFFFESIYENNYQKNFHDWGINCWGGWASEINGLIERGRFYDAVLNIVSRMKQVTVDDPVSSFEKMCQFLYETRPYILLDDQEAEFFKDEIYWLTHYDFISRGAEDIKPFVKDVENDTYYVDLNFQSHDYRLAVSNQAYDNIIRR
jgi:hypothetical protein